MPYCQEVIEGVIRILDVIRKFVDSLECLLVSSERLCYTLKVMIALFVCDFEQSEKVYAKNKQ